MSVTINSTTTNYFDYSVAYNYYTRQVTLTDTSSYKAGGAALVQGIDFKITSPSGITLWNNTSYAPADIEPSAPVPFTKNLAYFAGAIEYGTYVIIGSFKDQSGTVTTLTKSTTLCAPEQCSTGTAANGCAAYQWTVRCVDNIILIEDTTNFQLTVNGTVYSNPTVTYALTLINPNNVTVASAVNVPAFNITPVVNGDYTLSINDTAVYAVGDSVTVTVHYILANTRKAAQCNINLCEVYCVINDIYNQWLAVQGTGSQTEKTLKSKWEQLSLLIGLANIAIACGNDASTLIVQIETISGVDCNCNCGTVSANQGASISPNQNIVINDGVGDISVTQTTVGLTTTFVVSDVHYVIQVAADGTSPSYLTVTNVLAGGVDTYSIAFNPALFLSNVLYNDHTPVSTATVAVETLHTYTLPANTLTTNGSKLIIEVGISTNNAGPASNLDTKRGYLEFNGTSLLGTLLPYFHFGGTPNYIFRLFLEVTRISNTDITIQGMVYQGNGIGVTWSNGLGVSQVQLLSQFTVTALNLTTTAYVIRTRGDSLVIGDLTSQYMQVDILRK